MECIANRAGCILADCVASAFAGYGLRAQEGGARLDLLRGIGSVHGVDGDASKREARLRRFWTDTRSRNRELRFVDDGRAVEVRQFDASRGDWWKLPLPGARQPLPQSQRSEEHTSELQSLMRISYAVFCLKKKKII